MFENMNPMDRPTAFLEIAILLLITFILGYVSARIPIGSESPIKKPKRSKKTEEVVAEEEIDPRDIITEPTAIRAVLTRDRKGNAINPVKSKDSIS